jgi:hypothetical protein
MAERDWRASNLTLVVEDPVEPTRLEAFLALHTKQVQSMRNGVPVIAQEQREILDSGQYLGLYAYDGDGMVGGSLWQHWPDRQALRGRYSAARHGETARVLYLRAVRIARTLGYKGHTGQ